MANMADKTGQQNHLPFLRQNYLRFSANDYTSAIKNKIAPAKKLTIIHLGINPMDYNFLMQKEAQNQLFPNLDIQCPSDVLIGTIGEFTKNKGQKYLIESVNQLGHSMSKLKYVLIGWGESKMNLKSQISNHDLEKSIFVIDKNDLLDKNSANYLKAFDIFVLPSLKEGLPYVILEAGLARLPVIASSVGGIPEIIENGKDGLLVPPANSKELATAIKKLVGNKTLRENLAKNLREKILKEFSLEKMLRETTSLYKKIK